MLLMMVYAVGSSPHTRGAPFRDGITYVEKRIIPAYAGSTESGPTEVLAARDHPRIRGEHPSTIGLTVGCMGSSPHTRGAHGGRSAGRRVRGIIPAYAGSTRCRGDP